MTGQVAAEAKKLPEYLYLTYKKEKKGYSTAQTEFHENIKEIEVIEKEVTEKEEKQKCAAADVARNYGMAHCHSRKKPFSDYAKRYVKGAAKVSCGRCSVSVRIPKTIRVPVLCPKCGRVLIERDE